MDQRWVTAGHYFPNHLPFFFNLQPHAIAVQDSVRKLNGSGMKMTWKRGFMNNYLKYDIIDNKKQLGLDVRITPNTARPSSLWIFSMKDWEIPEIEETKYAHRKAVLKLLIKKLTRWRRLRKKLMIISIAKIIYGSKVYAKKGINT